MKISEVIRLVLVVEILAVLGTTLAVAKDYQDIWILNGLEIPFIILISTYLVYVFVEKKVSWVLVFAILIRSVLIIIPNLKYVWFLGIDYDEQIHYRLFQSILNQGFIPNDPLYINNMLYLQTPLMHIMSSLLTQITAFPPVLTFKILPLIYWLPYPLLIYLIIKKSVPGNEKIHKFALLISSIPLGSLLSYEVIGTLVGTLYALFLLAYFSFSQQSKKRSNNVVVIFLIFALVFAHSYSSIILIIGLLMMYFLSKVKFIKRRFAIPGKFNQMYLIILIIVTILWNSYAAINLFSVGTRIFAQWINAVIGIAPTGATFTDINAPVFILSLENQLRIFTFFYGGTLFSLFLTFLGIIIVIRKYRSSKHLIFFAFYLLFIWSFFGSQLILTTAKAGLVEFIRIFAVSLSLAPIFIALVLFYIYKRTKKIKLHYFIICAIVILATIEVYRYQPLLPIASSVRPNLPSDQYIIYGDNVNSAYQRYMISHAEEYINEGYIACDPITRNQIIGMTDFNFSVGHLANYYPFDAGPHEKEFDYFLIHQIGKSGWQRVKPEFGTRDFIFGAIYNSSVIYSNGESYMLTKPFMYNVSSDN